MKSAVRFVPALPAQQNKDDIPFNLCYSGAHASWWLGSLNLEYVDARSLWRPDKTRIWKFLLVCASMSGLRGPTYS
jgi:hypothetical protein